MKPDPAFEREALRQQMLVRALLGDARAAVVAGWMRDGARFERGFGAYRAHAAALAARTLQAAYPTLAELIGDEGFEVLARRHWRHAPPARGDLAEWGATLADFVADEAALADEPYLADVARLEWAVHRAGAARDEPAAAAGLERLATGEPAALRLVLRAGSAIVRSAHPIAAIWLAHRLPADHPERFADVRAAFAAGRGERALVWRRGLRVEVAARSAAEAAFDSALLGGRPLGAALDAAGPDFAFEPWLLDALGRGLVVRVEDATAG